MGNKGALMRRNTILALGLLVLILAAMAAKSLLVGIPPVRKHVPAGQFDAVRAKARLARVLGDQRPHPADSEGSDAVRSRLVAELQATGLKPVVRDQVACNDFQKARLVACARVRNVIAVLGPTSGKALLLNAHYDSVPVGPGAGDDGVGVATLLEVGAILRDRPLNSPVILLFNEGEELGLIGARAFLADPLSRNVNSMLNFEARGVTGPVTMFETSQPNGPAVAAFSSAVQRPFASSLMTDVYQLMPNDTDVSTFKERGWLALNFAMTGNETRYHSPGDDLAALDIRSLQHMGDQALAVSTEFARGVPQAQGQRIFIDVLGRGLIQMPLLAGMALFALLLVSFAVLVIRRRAFGGALAAVGSAVVASSVAGWVATILMGALRAGTYWRAHTQFTFVAIYATVLLALVCVLTTIGRRSRVPQLRAAFWALFLLIGGALALAAPGAIVYFLAPPLTALLGIAMSRWSVSAERIGAIVALVVLYITWGEMLALLEELFSPGPLWIVAPVSALLMLPALIEAMPLLKNAQRRFVVSGSLILGLAALAAAVDAPAYSADRQQRFTIEHVTQFPSGKSQWSLLNEEVKLPSAYDQTGPWRRAKLPFSDRMRWLAPALPIGGLKPPTVDLLESTKHGDERAIRLRLHSNGAERLALIAPEEARIRSAGLAGSVRPIGGADSDGKFTITCSGRSCDGAELVVDLAAKPTIITIVGARNGLPATAGSLLKGRPAFARPQYTPDETVAVTRVKV